MNTRFGHILGVLLLGSTLSFAQSRVDNDAQFWGSFYIEKKITDSRFLPHLKIQHRQTENFIRPHATWADLGLSYKFNDMFTFSFDYVYTGQRRKDNSISNQHQLYGALYTKLRKGYWSLHYRFVIQGQMKDIYSSAEGRLLQVVDRHKFTLQRKLSRQYNVYVADEVVYPIWGYKEPYLRRNRVFFGLEWNLTKKVQLDFYFMLQRKFSKVPDRDFVYGFTYNISI